MDPAYRRALAEWADRNPRIRRAWGLGDGRIGLELQPVADSEESIAVWLAKSGKWQAELEARFGTAVAIEFLDPDVPRCPPREQDGALLYERIEAV